MEISKFNKEFNEKTKMNSIAKGDPQLPESTNSPLHCLSEMNERRVERSKNS